MAGKNQSLPKTSRWKIRLSIMNWLLPLYVLADLSADTYPALKENIHPLITSRLSRSNA